jgi:2-C-methyl-D-erythritol 4-phosphate cytidylyltransferase
MSHTPRIYALMVAAGVGASAGGALPKQYTPLMGKAMLRYSLENSMMACCNEALPPVRILR